MKYKILEIKSCGLGSRIRDMEAESYTLESGIDVGQGISVGPGKFIKKNKRRALNKRRAWKVRKKE